MDIVFSQFSKLIFSSIPTLRWQFLGLKYQIWSFHNNKIRLVEQYQNNSIFLETLLLLLIMAQKIKLAELPSSFLKEVKCERSNLETNLCPSMKLEICACTYLPNATKHLRYIRAPFIIIPNCLLSKPLHSSVQDRDPRILRTCEH